MAERPVPASISVVIADDHPVVRSGIRDELAKHPDLRLLGEATTGDEALRLTEQLHPDVLLLDINMPGLRAPQVVKAVLGLEPRPEILVLSAFGEIDIVNEMVKAGISGYMLKDEDPSLISEGIRAVMRLDIWLSPAVSQRFAVGTIRTMRDDTRPQLTARELQVLGLMARGTSNEDLARQLSLTIGTVKNHVSNIYSKLGVRTRAEAVAWAWQHGLGGGASGPNRLD